MASDPVLPRGIYPYLTVEGAGASIEFYKKAFAAEEVFRKENAGKIMHARLIINGSMIMLSDDFPEMRGGSALPKPSGVTLHLQVDDADAWWSRALEAGATVKFPISDQFWGDRYGQVHDPFGHSWSIGSPLSKD